MPYTKLEDVNVSDIDSILAYPLTGDFYFWGKILLAIFFVITFSSYFAERRRLGKGNFLSSAAVGSISVIVLAFLGSLFGIVTKEIFTIAIVLGGLIIFVWFIKS